MKKSFILHDESVNTYGFRMITSGADLTEFRKNPVMLLNHNDWSLPIGRWENIRVEDGKILADPVFDLKDERGKEVSQKVADDFVRMASIGAWPPDEILDTPEMKLPGQTLPTVTKWRVREASIVTIGGNHNALAFYDADGNNIDLTDTSNIVKLVDSINYNRKMKELLKILQLADNATENDAATAMRAIISNHDRLKAENLTLKDRIDEVNKKAKDQLKNEAIALVDIAIKDGRLNVSGKDAFLKLFDIDFESAKATLEGIPARQSVVGRIGADEQSSVELADLQKKDWDNIDREGKLPLLKDKYLDLYKEKFKTRFGCEPKL